MMKATSPSFSILGSRLWGVGGVLHRPGWQRAGGGPLAGPGSADVTGLELPARARASGLERRACARSCLARVRIARACAETDTQAQTHRDSVKKTDKTRSKRQTRRRHGHGHGVGGSDFECLHSVMRLAIRGSPPERAMLQAASPDPSLLWVRPLRIYYDMIVQCTILHYNVI